MSPDTFTNSYGFRPTDFAPPKQIDVSPEALSEARQFLSELESRSQGTKWIVAFTWCYDRTFKKSPDSPAIDEGPGIDLAGYRVSEIPADAVDEKSGVPLAFIIPHDKFENADKKEIVQTRLVSGRLSYELE
ncbi:MAG: hypothetical protein JO136_03715 [Hyphomicrobiales bacterium]|nr:hypothetical protein [Hyphomicrobiales bacterium]MBV9909669.1 hypothetical protein [Hyphomicrobiales bacterium]